MADGDERKRPREPMERVRVGVTGLAAVVLLVAVFFVVASFVRRNAVPDNAAVANQIANASDDEPLAQLGVAPSKTDNASKPNK